MIIRKYILPVFFFPFFIYQLIFSGDFNQELRWDWNSINLQDETFWKSLTFPKNFLWGTATSAKQIEGTQTADNKFVENNWTIDSRGQQYKNNVGNDHWNRYKEDVSLIKNLGMNAYRFSIAWEKIEPQEGIFDQQAMDHYEDLCVELKKRGIEPWVCLFHFTTPVWFTKQGGFKNKENIQYFVRFCNYIFDALHTTVTYWATSNEPVAFAMEGYFRGTYPPGEKSLKSAGTVLCNLLNAHVEFYHYAKQHDPHAQIGLIHMFHPIDPYNSYNPLEQLTSKLANYLIHDTVLNFFKTGTFDWLYLVRDKNSLAPSSLDFIGVNYYCHELVQISPFKGIHLLKARESEQTAPDNGKSIYPEGLYRSIQKAATLQLPIYITENGVADTTDMVRNDFIKKHLFAVNKALQDGYDIRGYFWWALMDTLGWKKDYHSAYGLYALDPETKNRVLREGAKPFQKFLSECNQLTKINIEHRIILPIFKIKMPPLGF